MQNELIFDLGLHDGSDTRFYLGKGFRVVALEANPKLVEKAEHTFAREISEGQLILVNRALTKGPDSTTVSFYINTEKDDWSSTSASWAGKEGHDVQEISVKSITVDGMISRFGHPYYIKCDVEGEDRSFIEQISRSKKKPKYLSVEGGGPYYINILETAGYSDFQIVNQLLHFKTSSPNPPREGTLCNTRFTNVMSGLFGRELPEDRWWSGDKTIDVLEKFKELRAIDRDIAPGWVDLHAKLGD